MQAQPLQPAQQSQQPQPAQQAVDQGGFPATRVLVIANILVFCGMVIVSGGKALQSPDIDLMINWGANYAPLSFHGEWWRIFTSMFLHFGFMHIAFNMAALWNLGESAEQLYGTRRYINLYVLSGLGGSCLSLLFNPGVVSAGASGAIFGVYGALFAYFFARRKEMGSEAFRAGSKSATAFILVNVALGLTFGFDNFAHAGGLITGFVCGLMYIPRSRSGFALHPVFGTAIVIGVIMAAFNYAKKVPFDLSGMYHLQMAEQYGRANDADSMKSELNLAVKRKPDDKNTLRSLYDLLMTQKMYTQAMAVLNRLLEIDPSAKDVQAARTTLATYLEHSSDGKTRLRYQSPVEQSH